jgi:hypothetical protein
MIDQVLQKNLTDVQYSPDKIPELTKQISNELLAGVKRKLFCVGGRLSVRVEMNFDRYKFVVEVTLCEAKSQGIRSASRCLWDTTVDSCASAFFKNVRLSF